MGTDLLGDLPQETSQEILQEMEPEQREEVSELLGHEEHTAAGRMTTEYMALGASATVKDAIELLRHFEGDIESISTFFLVDQSWNLIGAVPLSRIVLVSHDTPLIDIKSDPLISVSEEANENEVAETFDKYNLLSLPVIDNDGKLTGVITADDVISLLRGRLK